METISDREGKQWIEVPLAPANGDAEPSTFVGRWLVVPGASTESGSAVVHGVAMTEDGRIAVYARPARHPSVPTLELYERLNDIPSATLPDNIREIAARRSATSSSSGSTPDMGGTEPLRLRWRVLAL